MESPTPNSLWFAFRAQCVRLSSEKFVAVVVLAITLSTLPAAEAQVYRWTDENGETIYSSTPQHEAQSPAALPDVARENIKQKISNIKDSTPVNCDSHGGVDCSQGKDSEDSSVVCLDGFRDAVLPYEQACSEVKLQAEIGVEYPESPEAVAFDKAFNDGHLIDKRIPQRLVVSVRNLSGIAAKNVTVEFNIPFVQRKADAIGPDTVPAFGTEEYALELGPLMLGQDMFRVAQSKLKVSCSNCLRVQVRR